MKAEHQLNFFAVWIAFLSVATVTLTASSTALAQVTDNQAVVHLRTLYTDPYLERASQLHPEQRPFNSVWVTAQFDPGSEDGGNPSKQTMGVKEQMEFARGELGIDTQGGYVLNPTDWLSLTHWERRAEALERVIVDAELSGVIALDIKAYEFEGASAPPPPADSKELQALLTKACRPIIDVLKRHNLAAVIYPAGGRTSPDYTAAALALGGTKLGDEFTFAFSERIAEGDTMTKEEWSDWKEYLTGAASAERSEPIIPGFLASMLRDTQDLRILRALDVVEAWLYVDDEDWLLQEPPQETSDN